MNQDAESSIPATPNTDQPDPDGNRSRPVSEKSGKQNQDSREQGYVKPVCSRPPLAHPVGKLRVELVDFKQFPSVFVHQANALIAETTLSVFHPTIRSALFPEFGGSL